MFNAGHTSSTEQRANLNQALASEARLNRIHRLFKPNFNVTEPSLILEPYLFLGNCISAQDIHRLSRLGIRYILNVAIRDVEICPYYPKEMRTLSIDLRDDDRENIIRTFDEAFAFIDEARRVKSRVLVHCSHGQSRSPAIVIGYLMRTYNVALEQCLAHVIKARPCVIPNDGFLKQLILYDRFLVDRRRRRQQEIAMKEAAEKVPPTEIPIQHHPSDASHTVQASAPVVLNPPQQIIHSTPDNPTMVASSSSSSFESQSTSSGECSTDHDSIQVIPIQIQREEPKVEKTAVVKTKRISSDHRKSTGRSTSSSNQSVDNIPEAHNTHASQSSRTVSTSSLDVSELKRRTSEFETFHVKHGDHPAIVLTPEQWAFINSIPASHSGADENVRTNYITEVYDRATKRFIPTTCCY